MATPIFTKNAPQPIGPYSQAIKVGSTVYLSGQIGLDLATSSLVEGGISEQTHQVFCHIKAVAEAAGGGLGNIVKLNVFLTDLSYFSEFNSCMTQHFVEPYPARAVIGVSSLPRGACVEVEATMVFTE